MEWFNSLKNICQNLDEKIIQAYHYQGTEPIINNLPKINIRSNYFTGKYVRNDTNIQNSIPKGTSRVNTSNVFYQQIKTRNIIHSSLKEKPWINYEEKGNW